MVGTHSDIITFQLLIIVTFLLVESENAANFKFFQHKKFERVDRNRNNCLYH